MALTEICIIFLANLFACFCEGGFGFGGSLIFITLTLPFLGWSTSIFTDCLLAILNLTFTSFLYREDIQIRTEVLPAALIGLLPLSAGILIFGYIPEIYRIIPFVFVGVTLLFTFSPKKIKIYPAVSALSIGFANTEAPFGYLYFQVKDGGIGNTSLFTAILLLVKVILLIFLWQNIRYPNMWFIFILALCGLPAAYLGKKCFSGISKDRRHKIVKFGMLVILIILMVGGLNDR